MEELLRSYNCTTSPLYWLLRGGSTRRYHTEGVAIQQDVAQHTWRVQVILLHLWPNASPELLKAALYHDAAEGLTGDIPAPVKRDPALKAAIGTLERGFLAHLGLTDECRLTDEEKARLKCADYLELVWTCSEQEGRAARRIAAKGAEYVLEATARLRCVKDRERVYALLEEILND